MKVRYNFTFYEILGGKYVGQKMLEKEGIEYVAIAFGWDDIRTILAH